MVRSVVMKVNWLTNEQAYTFQREADVGILLLTERLIGQKRYAAVAVEGAAPVGISIADFIATGEKFLIGDKFRTLKGAQAAGLKYLRAARRDIARRRAGKIDVVEMGEATAVFVRRWGALIEVPQA